MILKDNPLILITNDDGVQAKGLQTLIDAIRPFGQVLVVAPGSPRSGMSGAITSEIPLRLSLINQEDGLTIYSCTGTPVDCIKIALHELTNQMPDLLISGINHGSNSAVCVHYSGTLGAAIEGCIVGIPSFGISLTSHSAQADFSIAKHFAAFVAEKVLKEGLPKGIFLNVNVPAQQHIKGIKICTQTDGRWIAEYVKATDAIGRPVYWLSGTFENNSPNDEATDEWALKNGYVSIVPSKIDMTAYEMVEVIKHWQIEMDGAV